MNTHHAQKSSEAGKALLAILLALGLASAIAPCMPQKAHADDSMMFYKARTVHNPVNYGGWAIYAEDGTSAWCAEPGAADPDESGTLYTGGKHAGASWDYLVSKGYPNTVIEGYSLSASDALGATHIAGWLLASNGDYGGGMLGLTGTARNACWELYTAAAGYRGGDASIDGASTIWYPASGGYQAVVARASKGRIDVQKTSENPALTNGNGCYSLQGAEYGVYRSALDAQNDAHRADTLITDESGRAESVDLAKGAYYVRETKAPQGYLADKTVYPVEVAPNATARVNGSTVTDAPGSCPAGVLVGKKDAETGATAPLAAGSLAGAEFTVEYFDGIFATAEKAYASGEPTRTWVFATDEKGVARFSDLPVSGDPIYANEQGDPVLPYGTYVYRETKAPQGYLLPADPSVFVTRVVYDPSLSNGDGSDACPLARIEGDRFPEEDSIGDSATVQAEQIKRGDLEFSKADETTMHRLANVPFELISDTTGERHVLVSDANGVVSTSATAHSANTNANDNATVYDADAGVWFGQDEQGNKAPVNDALGALPYDTYTLNELRAKANEGRTLATGIKVAISRNGHTVNLGTIDDRPQLITTAATDGVDGDKELAIDPEMVLIDTIDYTGLAPGKRYIAKGKLMVPASENGNAEGAEPLLSNGEPVVAETEFTAIAETGTVEVVFSFNGTALADGSEIVVFEELYADDDPETPVMAHADATDEEQTVQVRAPFIGTTAAGTDGKKEITAQNPTAVVDTIDYTGLVPGKEYAIEGILMDKATGEALLADGQEVTANATFVPDSSDGTLEVTFEFDGRAFAGTEAVVFERVYRNGIEVAAHADLADESQTVALVEQPSEPPLPATEDSTLYLLFLPILGICAAAALVLVLAARKRAGANGDTGADALPTNK